MGTSEKVDICCCHPLGYGAGAMTSNVRFYDPSTAWGVIAGDDGILYMMDGDQLPVPPPREGERVRFDSVGGPGGPRAARVQRLSRAMTPPNSNVR